MTLDCSHCDAAVSAAADCWDDAAYQRRLLRFLDLGPFFAGTRGPMCLLHTIVAVGIQGDAIAAEYARRNAS